MSDHRLRRIGRHLCIAIGCLLFLTTLTPRAAAEAGRTERANPYVIEEVVVTARKREERLIDTPVAAAVMTAEEIDRYRTRDLSEITQRIPGVQITHAAGGGAGGNMVVRGVGNIAVDYGADQPVSLVIDGMSFSRGHVLDTGFFDVAAVEVLKGPQALYFGKNSPAGVIAVTSISPEVGGEWDGFLRGSYEFESEDPVFEGGISFPLGDTIAMRIAGRYQDMDGGWLKNSAAPIDNTGMYLDPSLTPRGASMDEFPKQEQTVVRWTTVFEPSDRFDATLKMFYSESEQNEAGYTVLYDCADGVGGHPWYLGVWEDTTQTCTGKAEHVRNSALPPAGIADEHPFINANDRFFNYYENDIYTLNMNWEVGDFTLSSLTSYWDYFHREYTNYDYTSFAVVVSKQGESGDAWTQELRLQSNFDGPVNFMIGGFYEDMERDLDAPVQILPGAFFDPAVMPWPNPPEPYTGSYLNYHQHWDNSVESWSVFGSVDWDIGERWTISGGARYTEEKRETIGGNLFENSGFLGFSPTGIVYNPKDTRDNVSPELTVSFKPSADVMLFAAYKTGFQSFGISNPGTVPNIATFTPEQVNDTLIFDESTTEGIEVGLKGYFLDGRLSADIVAYFYESEDLQVGIFNSNTTTFTLQNAGVAHNVGVEFQGVYQATERLQLRTSISWNELKFDEWEDAGCNPIDGALAPNLPTQGPGCHIGPQGAPIQDMSGEKYGTPPFQMNLGFTWIVPFGGWSLSLTGDAIHHSSGYDSLKQDDTAIPSRTIAHFSGTFYQESGPWELGIICSNCFDKKYVTSIQNKPLAKINPGVNGDLTAQIAPPRLITAQLTYNLGRR